MLMTKAKKLTTHTWY